MVTPANPRERGPRAPRHTSNPARTPPATNEWNRNDMRKIITVTALLAVLALSACSGGDPATPGAGRSAGASTSPTQPQPKRLAWGQPAEVIGAKGGKLRITPLGVLYHRGPYTSGVDGPENDWFVVIALKAEAIDKPDSPQPPMSGGGFMWQGNSEKITSIDGNATSTPWVGAVNEFSNVPIQPGESEVGIETFDVPTKTGGRLIYVNADDQSVTSWDLPSTDQGTGLDKVRKRIKMFS